MRIIRYVSTQIIKIRNISETKKLFNQIFDELTLSLNLQKNQNNEGTTIKTKTSIIICDRRRNERGLRD